MIELRGKGDMYILMERSMMGSGWRISNMGKGLRYGLIRRSIRACISMARSMGRVYFSGRMDLLIRETLIIIILRGMGFTFGLVSLYFKYYY
jgi:hypothetical protein